MKNIKRIFALMLVFGMIASLVACDVESLLSDVLEDVEDEDIADVLENKTSKEEDSEEESKEEIEDDEKEEVTTKKKWPSWLGGGEKDTVVVETQTIVIEWDSADIWYPVEEEWPDEPVGELEYTLEYSDMGEEYYVLSNIGSWKGKQLYISSEYNGIPVKKIGYSAFMGANGLEVVKVEEGIEEIDMWAFGHCENLREIQLPSTITYISERVFTYSNNIDILECHSARYETVHNCIIDTEYHSLHTVTNRYSWALPELIENYGLRAIGNDACRGLTELYDVKIPDNIEEIGAYAFYGCSNLMNIGLGSTESSKLSHISIAAFSYCPNIKSINIVGENEIYYSERDCLIERNTGRLVLGCANSYIPKDGSVTIIGGFAFEGNTNLVKIEIPASVKVIEIAAFEGCSNLRGVRLYEGLEVIEQRAFCHDNNLKDITIPSTVTHIGEEAFRGVPALDDSYTEPEYNYGVTIKPDGSYSDSFNNVIVGGFAGNLDFGDKKIVSMKMNSDGSYTVTFDDGSTQIMYSVSSDKNSSSDEGNLGFTTIVGDGNTNVIYKPYP